MNEEKICTFCKKTFISNITLIKHQNTAKFCLAIQNKEPVVKYNCDYCNKEYIRKDALESHMNSCKINENKNLKKELNNIKKTLEKQLKQNEENKELKNELIVYMKLYEEEKQKVINLENKNSKLENDIKELACKAIENIGNKTINNNTTNKNNIINNLHPLTNDHMKDQTKHLTYGNIKNGAHGIAHFASNYTFKDRLMCTDISRLNFVFKNENDIIVKDPEGVEITKRFIEINREEIVRLVNEYLNYITEELMNDSTSGEMYKFWADKREEFVAIRSAVMKGNVSDNEDSYKEFKKNFLLALSKLVPR